MNVNNEKPELIPLDSGFSVLYKSRYLYSKRSPEKNILQLISSLIIQPETLLLCISPVLGYGLKELLQKLPESSFVLGLECDENLMKFSKPQIDKTLLTHPNFLYVRTNSVNLLLKQIDTISCKKKFRRVLRIDFSGGAALNNEFYSQAFDFVSQYISQFWINRLTLIQFGRNFARNFFKNYYLILRSLSVEHSPTNKTFSFGSLIEKSIKKPIIVIGAGPSLDASINFIKENKDEFFILAVDAAAAGLYPDIKPDAIVLLESQYWIQKAFIGLIDSEIPIIADLTANPALICQLKGKTAFFFTNYAVQDSITVSFFALLEENNILPIKLEPMGSVGLAALALAEKLACDDTPIFHTGLDFSWAMGFSHSKASYQVHNIFSNTSKLKSLYAGESLFTERLNCEKGKDLQLTFTSPNLKSYSEIYKKVFADKEFFFDIGSSGLEINSKKTDCVTAKKIIADFYLKKNKVCFNDKGDSRLNFIADSYKNKKSKIKEFLISEKQKLIKLRNIFTGKIISSDEEIKLLLKSMPYLYLHFPDYNALPYNFLDKHFLSRVRIEIEYFLKIHLINDSFDDKN